jgi:hypothetical protein
MTCDASEVGAKFAQTVAPRMKAIIKFIFCKRKTLITENALMHMQVRLTDLKDTVFFSSTSGRLESSCGLTRDI